MRQAPVSTPSEAEDLAVAGRELRRLARDIAAGDVSPTDLRRRALAEVKSRARRRVRMSTP